MKIKRVVGKSVQTWSRPGGQVVGCLLLGRIGCIHDRKGMIVVIGRLFRFLEVDVRECHGEL